MSEQLAFDRWWQEVPLARTYQALAARFGWKWVLRQAHFIAHGESQPERSAFLSGRPEAVSTDPLDYPDVEEAA